MKTQRFPDIDYEFRPASYWELDDPLQAILSNVQGANRRRMIRDFWEAGRLEELANSHLRDVSTELENKKPRKRWLAGLSARRNA